MAVVGDDGGKDGGGVRGDIDASQLTRFFFFSTSGGLGGALVGSAVTPIVYSERSRE